MPFVTLAKIKPFLSQTIFNLLQEHEEDFAEIEYSAAEIVVAHSNITIPDNVEDAPQWVIFPMAHIIEYTISAQVELSKEVQDIILKKYQNAIALCRENTISESIKNGQFVYGEFKRKYA